MFAILHGAVGQRVQPFSTAGIVEAVLPVRGKSGVQRLADKRCALRPQVIQLRLQKYVVHKQHARAAGQLGQHLFTFAPVGCIALDCLVKDGGAVLQLPGKGRLLTQPAQVVGGRGAVPDKLRNQHTRHMVIELVARAVVRVGAVRDGKLCVIHKALRNLATVQKTVIGRRVGKALAAGVGGAVAPAAGDQIQQKGVGLYVGAVHQPVIVGAVLHYIGQFLGDELGGVGQHRNVAGRLQIVEGSMVVDAMGTIVAARRQGRHAGVVVFLAAADHLAVAVVRPDFNNILRQVQKAVLVQLHSLAVQVGAADGVPVVGFDEVILFFYQGGNQRAALFRRVVLGVVVPERLVALPAETDVPDHAHTFLRINARLPQCAEFLRVLAVHRLQVRVGLGEHLRAQRLGVVVGDDKPHIGSRPAVQHGVFACAGDHHVAAQTQQCLERHDERQIGAALDFPVGEQCFIVDEPAAVPDFIRFGLHHRSGGNLLPLPHGKRLVVPEPERLHA